MPHADQEILVEGNEERTSGTIDQGYDSIGGCVDSPQSHVHQLARHAVTRSHTFLPMPMTTDLPTELWLLITRDFSDSELFKLKSLNSLFLNCWMDIAWKQVQIDGGILNRTVRLLHRVADPFVARRIKTLSIICGTPLLTVTSLLLHSLSLLPSITSLLIVLSEEASTFFASLFQTISSSSIARTLQKLRLYGHADMFASLVDCSAHATPFGNLTQFGLRLYCRGRLGGDNSKLQPNLSRTFAPFLRTFAPTLQLLCITNWSKTLDLSPFFNALTQPFSHSKSSVPFAKLKSVFFALAFHQSSHQSLLRFLLPYNNLQHLHLTHVKPLASPDPSVDELTGTWLADLVNNAQFPSLQTLRLLPSTTQTGLSANLTLIKRTAPTLTSLTIDSRYLSHEEAKQLLDALTKHVVQVQPTTMAMTTKPITTTKEWTALNSLSMNIAQLTVPLLELLAHKLPQLDKLSLSVSGIEDSFCDVLHHRRYDRDHPSSSTQDILHVWKLRYLSIYRAEHEMDHVMHVVVGAVPSALQVGNEERRQWYAKKIKLDAGNW